ncbi:MAG: hypothetical protein WAL70_02660 [Aeromicrobium sp.]
MIFPRTVRALVSTSAACTVFLLAACGNNGDGQQPDSATPSVKTTSSSDEPTAGTSLDDVKACLEGAGLSDFFVNKNSAFPGVEFQIDGPLKGDGAFLVYGYQSAAKAKAEQDTISINAEVFPKREIVGRSVVIYGSGLTKKQRGGLDACVEPL